MDWIWWNHKKDSAAKIETLIDQALRHRGHFQISNTDTYINWRHTHVKHMYPSVHASVELDSVYLMSLQIQKTHNRHITAYNRLTAFSTRSNLFWRHGLKKIVIGYYPQYNRRIDKGQQKCLQHQNRFLPGGFWLQSMSTFMILDNKLSHIATTKWKQ